MFINFWYPAEMAADLKTEPKKCTLLGQNLVLFRDSKGQAHCLSDACVHRGASLAAGWTKGNNVTCPYHGWEYDSAGVCTRIPSLGPNPPALPPRAQVDSYPTQERYGIIFVFLGDLPEEERPPVMDIPEWGNPKWRASSLTYQWNANYRRVVENALDFSHPEFVHLVGRKGEDPNYQTPDYEIEEHPWGAGAHITFLRQAKGFFRFFRDKGTESSAGTTFHGPAQFVTKIHIDERMWTYQYAFEAPIDQYRVRTFLVNCRNFFTSPLFDSIADKRNKAIIEEDRVIAENIEPVIGHEGSAADLSVKADAIQLAYRKKLKEWQDKGWRIDVETVAAAHPGKDHYTIPCPRRRENKNWVYKPLPMLPSQTA